MIEAVASRQSKKGGRKIKAILKQESWCAARGSLELGERSVVVRGKERKVRRGSLLQVPEGYRSGLVTGTLIEKSGSGQSMSNTPFFKIKYHKMP